MKTKLKGINFLFAIVLAFFSFFLFTDSVSAAVTGTGTYVSDIKSTGVAVWGTMTWSISSGGTATVKVRSCDDAACSGETAINSCTAIASSGTDITSNSCVTDGDNYIQYQVYFSKSYSTTVDDANMTLNSVVINYTQYTSGASTLTSSKYSASAGNIMGGVEWVEDTTLPTGTAVGLYLRTASTEGGLTGAFNHVATSTPSTLTANCSKVSTTVTCNSAAIIAAPGTMGSGGDDDFYQYMVILDSTGLNTPTVTQVKVTYVVNAAPTFNSDYPGASDGGVSASQGSDGQITIAYSIKDTDTTVGAYNTYVVPTYYYSLNGVDYTEITSGLSAGATSNKTVAEGSYTEHTGITWNPKSMIDDNYSATAKIKVSAYDGEAANHTTEQASASFTLDTTDPTPGATPLIVQATSTPAAITISGSDNSTITMKVGLESDLASATWETYATSDTISLATDPDTVYLQFKDAYSNTSTIASLASIETPSYMMIQDTTNLDIPEYREFISWKVVGLPAAGFGEYRVLRSESEGSGYSIIRSETDRAINSYVDTSVVFNTSYYYKVAHVDADGNTSYLTSAINGKANGVQDVGEGSGGTSADVPNITGGGLAVSSITTTGATVTWETADSFGSDSLVEYITVGGGDFTSAPSQGVATLANTEAALGKHSVTLIGLTPNTPYYIQVKSANTAPDTPVIDTYKYDVNGTSFTTNAGPAISSTSHGTPTTTAATITWTTTESADSYVYYSTAANMDGAVRVGSDSDVTSHSVTVSGLTIDTTYYYYITSTDSEANTATDNNSSNYYTFDTAADSSDPAISGVASTATTNTATIIWTTDELSDSQVFYATDADYSVNTYSDQTSIDSTLTRNHGVTLSSLTPGTTYHYMVRSADAGGNVATSTDTTFDLTGNPPVISSVATSSVTTSGATITWTTDKASDSVVEYITTNNDVYTNAPSQGKAESVTSHSVALTGLTASTTYYFRVKSTDSDANTGTGAGSNFTTNSGPTITFVKATGETVTEETATITWTTDLSSDSKVVYSTSDDLSNPITVASTTMATSHEIVVNGLTLNSTYYYYLQSTDSEGNIATDNNSGSYWPLSTSADTTDPSIVDYSVVTSTSTATITWETDELSTSQVIYDTTSNYGTDASLDSGPDENTTYTIEHSVVLTGLTADTDYSFSMISKDASNNDVESSVLTFATIPTTTATCPACPPCRSGGGGVTACARPDKDAPTIIGMYVANVTSDTAKVIWRTNEEASGLVKFGEGNNLESEYDGIRGDADKLNLSHLVQLVNLSPNTKYFYQAIAKDKSSNVGKSEILNFTTESASQDLIDKAKEGLEDILDIENQINEEDVDEANSILQAGISKINDIIAKFSDVLSVEVLENSVKDSLSNIESLIPAPVIQGVPEIDINQNKVTIKWKTNKESNSIVLFVPEGEYDATLAKPYIYQTGNVGNLTTAHSITIPNLLPDTTYHYQIVSKSQVGPEAMLGNLTFATAQEIPEVTYSQIEEITDFSATVVWITNLPTDSLVKYVPFDEENEVYVEERSQVQGKAELVKNHLVTISNLDPGTTYQVTLQGKDENGTAYEFDMGELNTSRDVRVPLITNIKTESSVFPNQKDRIQSVITWATDEESTTQIAYLESGSDGLTEENILAALEEQKNFIGDGDFQPGTSSIKMTKLDPELTPKHVTVITKFKPATVYKFRAISVDPSGNVSMSPIFVTMTPQQKETVLEMIIKTFEDRFSWMRQLQ